MEIRENAVTEYGVCKRLNVFERNVVTAVNKRSCLGTQNQELGRSQAGSIVHVLFHVIGWILSARTACARKLNGVAHHFFRNGHFPDETLKLDDLGAADRLLELDRTDGRVLS